MKKTIAIAIIILVIILSFITYMQIRETIRYKNQGKQLIEQVENYYKKHSKLPTNIMELGLEPEMGEGPYYEKIDSIKYIIYFNIGFENTFTYYSDLKTWKSNP